MLPFLASVAGFVVRSLSATLTGASYADTGSSPNDASVTLTVNSNGTLSVNSINGGASDSYSWLVAGDAADCTLTVTTTSGSFSTASANGPLSSSRSYTVSRTALGTKSCTATFTITSGGTTLATVPITLTATVS